MNVECHAKPEAQHMLYTLMNRKDKLSTRATRPAQIKLPRASPHIKPKTIGQTNPKKMAASTGYKWYTTICINGPRTTYNSIYAEFWQLNHRSNNERFLVSLRVNTHTYQDRFPNHFFLRSLIFCRSVWKRSIPRGRRAVLSKPHIWMSQEWTVDFKLIIHSRIMIRVVGESLGTELLKSGLRE